jgi:hypothetical protein
MPKKKNYPDWFNQYFAPTEPLMPTEISPYPATTRLDKTSILLDRHGIEFDINWLAKKMVENGIDDPAAIWSFELDHSGCYYEGDNPDIILVQYKKEYPKNKRYAIEMKQYAKDLETYNERISQWKDLKDKWEKEETDEREKFEKALLKKLQKKYKK